MEMVRISALIAGLMLVGVSRLAVAEGPLEPAPVYVCAEVLTEIRFSLDKSCPAFRCREIKQADGAFAQQCFDVQQVRILRDGVARHFRCDALHQLLADTPDPRSPTFKDSLDEMGDLYVELGCLTTHGSTRFGCGLSGRLPCRP